MLMFKHKCHSYVLEMCLQLIIHLGGPDLRDVDPLRKKLLPAGGSRDLQMDCPPAIICITERRGEGRVSNMHVLFAHIVAILRYLLLNKHGFIIGTCLYTT